MSKIDWILDGIRVSDRKRDAEKGDKKVNRQRSEGGVNPGALATM
jgi:hypothetical protein